MGIPDYKNPPTSEQVFERLAELAIECPGATAAELLENLVGEAWVGGHNAGGEDAHCGVRYGIPGEQVVCVREAGHQGAHYDNTGQQFSGPRGGLIVVAPPAEPSIAAGLEGLIRPGETAPAPCGHTSFDLQRVCAREKGHEGGHRDGWGLWPQAENGPRCPWKGVSFACELAPGHPGPHATKDGQQWGDGPDLEETA